MLINDGSTDRSLNVSAKYSANDKRITVIDQENGGVAAARNRGLDVATGDVVNQNCNTST
jgi:glycosyltransferase involved in cell wall biosynthesis